MARGDDLGKDQRYRHPQHIFDKRETDEVDTYLTLLNTHDEVVDEASKEKEKEKKERKKDATFLQKRFLFFLENQR